jgi:hypothetical protein
MSVTHLLFLSIPAALAAFKLAALALAAVWAVSAAFESRRLLPAARREPLPVRARAPRG